jgi:hypothetical protein
VEAQQAVLGLYALASEGGWSGMSESPGWVGSSVKVTDLMLVQGQGKIEYHKARAETRSFGNPCKVQFQFSSSEFFRVGQLPGTPYRASHVAQVRHEFAERLMTREQLHTAGICALICEGDSASLPELERLAMAQVRGPNWI